MEETSLDVRDPLCCSATSFSWPVLSIAASGADHDNMRLIIAFGSWQTHVGLIQATAACTSVKQCDIDLLYGLASC